MSVHCISVGRQVGFFNKEYEQGEILWKILT